MSTREIHDSEEPDPDVVRLVSSSGLVTLTFAAWADGDDHARVLAELDEIAHTLRGFVEAEGVQLHRIVGGCRDGRAVGGAE